MVETASLVASLVVVASVVGAVPVAVLGVDGPAQSQVAGNETGNESMAPGERMSGVVGSERAAVEGEVDARAFGQRVAAARSNASRANVVAGQLENLQGRLAELRAEKADLQAARENGSISQGQYRARLAQLRAEQRSLQRLANDTDAVAGGLPAETLRENGVNVSAIQTLRSNARNLTGPQVAEIARNISGRNAGTGFGPDNAGPRDAVANRSNGTGPGNASGTGPGNVPGSGPGEGSAGGPPDNASDPGAPDAPTETPSANEPDGSGNDRGEN